MTIKDSLQALTYVVAIVGGIATAFIYFHDLRKESIATTRKEITRKWTNEGDVSSGESRFITLELSDQDGDIVGSLGNSLDNRELEVHAEVKWFSTTLQISDLQGRHLIPIAKVKIKVMENNNRLEWNIVENQSENVFPQETILWPYKGDPSR